MTIDRKKQSCDPRLFYERGVLFYKGSKRDSRVPRVSAQIKLVTIERATGKQYAMKIVDKFKCNSQSVIKAEINVLKKVRQASIINLWHATESKPSGEALSDYAEYEDQSIKEESGLLGYKANFIYTSEGSPMASYVALRSPIMIIYDVLCPMAMNPHLILRSPDENSGIWNPEFEAWMLAFGSIMAIHSTHTSTAMEVLSELQKCILGTILEQINGKHTLFLVEVTDL
ncbi:hypothetical protein HDU67_007878 [Dinochytrium kinnereticum]|nr:hypothetical protein HDU67_007878 [Dinochytrium kinnereticum]